MSIRLRLLERLDMERIEENVTVIPLEAQAIQDMLNELRLRRVWKVVVAPELRA